MKHQCVFYSVCTSWQLYFRLLKLNNSFTFRWWKNLILKFACQNQATLHVRNINDGDAEWSSRVFFNSVIRLQFKKWSMVYLKKYTEVLILMFMSQMHMLWPSKHVRCIRFTNYFSYFWHCYLTGFGFDLSFWKDKTINIQCVVEQNSVRILAACTYFTNSYTMILSSKLVLLCFPKYPLFLYLNVFY